MMTFRRSAFVFSFLCGSMCGADAVETDLCIYGGTPGGIAMAVSAAREGLDVVLVNRHRHLGGILASGLGVWDTLYEGSRAPIYDEVRQAIFDHYRVTFGEDSPQYRDALPGKSGHTNGRFESKVAEKILTDLVAREPRIRVILNRAPLSVKREGRLIKSITFESFVGDDPEEIKAAAFADCSYEGDLLPLAKVAYRVGRESRAEFGEPHAGRIFMRPAKERPDHLDAETVTLHEQLNLRRFTGFQAIIPDGRSGEGDELVQAFNYRTTLTSDPENRIAVTKPDHYDPEVLKNLEFGSLVHPLPNRKIGWNRPQLVGPHQEYVEGNRETRERVMDEHWGTTLALLFFLQNDPSVSAERRAFFGELGLAKDEYTDNGHRPHEFYVREGRRLSGRRVFTQHDAMLAPGLRRAPVHSDSIAITEWYLDTHACSLDQVDGSLDEGKMMLHYETFPGQISYRTLLPVEVDNLLVPVCLSSTHVAWGTIRLEPTWMQVGESAGLAVALALRSGTTPAELETDRLVRELCSRRSLLSFFNDVEVNDPGDEVPAIQYFGTLGYFPDYHARPDEILTEAIREVWEEGFKNLREGTLDPAALAVAVRVASEKESIPTQLKRADFLLGLWEQLLR